MTRDDIVASARGWIGTPYRHQASCKGAGCDCLGLLRGVWRDLLGEEPETVPPYTPDWSEPQRDERLWRAAARCLAPVSDQARPFRPGEVLLFRMRASTVAKHLGIVGQGGASPSFIHAYSAHGVAESPLSLPWRRRVAVRFDFPTGA
jgi:NlpC/P60 family putative phage cell wall peptidase